MYIFVKKGVFVGNLPPFVENRIRNEKKMIYSVCHFFYAKEVLEMKKFVTRWGHVIASLAVMVTAVSANSACLWLMHQPELPKSSECLKRR